MCQRVRAKHQRPAGFLQLLKVPEWKWVEIGMNFIGGLPCTKDGYDSIWVIVDRLTKVAHFILVNFVTHWYITESNILCFQFKFLSSNYPLCYWYCVARLVCRLQIIVLVQSCIDAI